MKTVKRIIALLMMLAIIFTLVACGGKPEPSGSGSTPTEQPKEENADGLEAGASLVYWSMWSETEPQAIVIAEAAKAFEAKTGIPVKINFNGRQLQRSGLEPALSAGEAIDLFDEDIDRVSGTWGPYLLSLDSYVNGTYSDTNGKPYLSLINQGLMNLAKEKGGGSYTVVPYQPFIFTTMYNKDLFAQAGISSTPKNWDEFLDVCAKLKDAGITAMTVDNAYIYSLFGYTLSRIVGADKCMEMVDKLDFSDPGVLRACQIFAELISKGYMSQRAATNVYPEGQNSEFALETVAIYLNGTWLPNELSPINPDLAWGSFPWPAIDAGGDGPEAHNIGAQSYGINKNTKYPNAAFAFIRWMTIGTYDQKLATDSMGVPMANDATWPAALTDAKAIFDGTTKRMTWAVGMEDKPEVSAAILDGFQKLVTGTYDAQQFADQLAAVK
jgi:raffinose/stachyose/melibiose transport system substrate-binding protein